MIVQLLFIHYMNVSTVTTRTATHWILDQKPWLHPHLCLDVWMFVRTHCLRIWSYQIFWSWFWLVHATQHGPLIGTDHLTLNIMQPTAYRILMPRNAAQDSVLTRNRKYQFMALPFVSGFRALSHTKYVFQPPAEQVKSPGRVNSLTSWGICKLMPR